MTDKKTKIVATLGPASETPETIEKLIHAGANVFRCNFSHGDHQEHGGRIKTIREVSKKIGIPVAILADLGGPKIRIGDFASGSVTLTPGKRCVLTSDACTSDAERMSVNYKKLPKEVSKGDIILLDDGKRRLLVESVKGNDITCLIEVGGDIKGRRGLSVPTAHLSISSLTPKDKTDLVFACKAGADLVALSFVRSADDVKELRALLKKEKSNAAIVAKIETREAVEKIDEIIQATDIIMVARGDLAVETSPEEVPLFQKTIIGKANRAGKPVITATQMLESMIEAPVPTRAEVSDVANALLDGTDAIMLSGETSLGEYPVGAVEVMTRVASHVERDYLHRKLTLGRRNGAQTGEVTDSVTASAVETAEALGARSIVALTMSGKTARMLSRHKPAQTIFAFTPKEDVGRQLSVSFGVRAVHIKPPAHIDTVLTLVRKTLVARGGKRGEKIVIVCGLPFGKSIDTNMVLVEQL